MFAEQGFGGRDHGCDCEAGRRAQGQSPLLFSDEGDALSFGVIERVLTAWLAAASSFDTSDDPSVALSAYIGAKMDLAREMPLATRIWSAEIMRGAPIIQDFLDTTLTEWVTSRERVVRRWIAAGKLKPIEPRFLFYMIWATTQQYANAAHEMATLNGGGPLDAKAFERAKAETIEIILARSGGGIEGAVWRPAPKESSPIKLTKILDIIDYGSRLGWARPNRLPGLRTRFASVRGKGRMGCR